MPSPADRQTEAIADRERIAKALYEELCTVGLVTAPGVWRALPDITQDYYRRVARNLLLDDVIRVGRRPNVERPMAGQISIEEFETGAVVRLGPPCEHEWEVANEACLRCGMSHADVYGEPIEAHEWD